MKLTPWQENRYDGLGRRRERVEFDAGVGVTNRYLYQDWRVLAVTDGEGNVLETYTHGADLSGQVGGGAGGIGGILASTQDGDAAYYHYDFNGNVVNVSSSNQTQLAKYTYGPFGEVLLHEGIIDSRYQFSTKELDKSTGMNYYGYRYYNPELGKWLNRDPMGEIGFKEYLYFMNDSRLAHAIISAHRRLVIFADNNPINIHDVLGLCSGNLTYTKLYCYELSRSKFGSPFNEDRNEECQLLFCFDPIGLIPGFSGPVKTCAYKCTADVYEVQNWLVRFDCLYKWECDCPESSGHIWRKESGKGSVLYFDVLHA